MHLEGEGSLGADISTMTSVHKHSIKKIFHNRAKIRNIFSHLALTPPVHFVQCTTVAALPDLVRVLAYQPCMVSVKVFN
jgi:hypothetical protein